MTLKVVRNAAQKRLAQRQLKREIISNLDNKGILNIGFPGGNEDVRVYANQPGNIWAAFIDPSEKQTTRRYWNAFGVYEPSKSAQTIVVEINIPSEEDSALVGGFIAEDSISSQKYLMHTGKIGGGRPGIGKSAFLLWSMSKLTDCAYDDGTTRRGIVIAALGSDDLIERIWKFVRLIREFKELASNGVFETVEFRHRVEEFERYSKEFSGKKKGGGVSAYEYLTYHGDIVQTIFEQRSKDIAKNQRILNSTLIDLFVKTGNEITEIYEVKTGIGRQALYTAIGQLVTHSNTSPTRPKMHLVIPYTEDLPADFKSAIVALDINVVLFKLIAGKRKKAVSLIWMA